MTEGRQPIEIESVPLERVAGALHLTRPFAQTPVHAVQGADVVDRVTIRAGATLVESGDPQRSYWVVLEGELRADRIEPDQPPATVGYARAGEGFGEVPLLSGKPFAPFTVVAIQDSVLVRFSEESFWALLACCPSVRATILGDMTTRLRTHQQEALHREKLISLGTLAAGLMHELNNPGTAARRAASQLRENLMRLQKLSLRMSDKPKTAEQMECMRGLLEHTLSGCQMAAMSSVDQADAEESMGAWLSDAGVENAYAIAPVLVGMRFDRRELDCARAYFDKAAFSDALNWLGALAASVALVCSIEDSIARVSELVQAVKKFAYDEHSQARELDVHESLQSTLTMLGHKMRVKEVDVVKCFSASPSRIQTRGTALSQVWTNLIDNAVDASPAHGQVEIATWSEPEWLAVSITDHGEGIPPEVLPRIFDAFFTTKPQGSGTGLGLEIVHRIVTQKFGGRIDVESRPGDTRFIVRLPRGDASSGVPASPAAQ
ncbi:MAG: ATP-binding protein [Terracidiphilus sp.]